MSMAGEQNADVQQLKRALGAIQKLRTRIDRLETAAREPVAIVGMGCRLPGGVDSPLKLWQLLRDGIEAVDEVPPGRWDMDAFYSEIPGTPGKLPARRAGFIEDVDQFDPGFFGISPREARAMDPQQRLILEIAWEALEDAGIPPDQLRGSRTGVFIGIGLNDYSRLQMPDQAADPELNDLYSLAGNVLCIAANRLSYLLDLRGPSMAIDTACSSSLVATHQAVQSLRKGESTLALVGGVNLLLAPETGISLGRMLAPDGRCKFGDAGADGFVRGEGAVVMAMKLLSQAQADGDPIYAVIRGSAVNQDGLTSGLTVPNGIAQQAVLRDALQDAGVAPADISYVEAHGTGTALGDPIEIQALDTILGAGREPDRPLLVGSVKTNLGHLEAGAGIAGLAKAVLALHTGKLPPSLHFDQPNPNIPFEQLAVQVHTRLTDWPAGQLLSGVSSFGFGGTNAHVILEEAPPCEAVELEEPGAQLLLLSARDEQALTDLASRYADTFGERPGLSLAAVCSLAATGRTHHSHRLALVGDSIEELRNGLSAAVTATLPTGASSGQVDPDLRPKVAFLFTGQGAQYAGMGRQLYETEAVFRETLDQCATILAPYLDQPLLDILFAAPGSPEAALLDQTAYTQPALFALEYALVTLWDAWGVRPSAVAGHSLGEYVAACVAGVLTLEDALRLVAARGRMMGALPAGGAMAAVFAPEATVREALAAGAYALSVAAVNGPEHIVVSGTDDAVAAFCAELTAAGVRVRPLTVSHAFHSPLMDPILDAFEALALGVEFHAPTIPLVTNLTGAAWPQNAPIDASYWRNHLREPVQFAASMQSLHALGCDVFVEVGPAPVLSGMGRATLPEGVTFAPSLRASDSRQLLKSLGLLYTSGVTINWAARGAQRPRRHLHLPTYAWQHQRYWYQPTTTSARSRTARPNQLHPLLDERLRSPALEGSVFQTRVGLENLQYLDGHRVYDTPIFPAAAFLEMALAAGRALDGRDLAVKEITFEEALAIPEECDCTVQTILRTGSEELQFEIVATTDTDAWRRHVTGSLTETPVATSIATLEDARDACREEIGSEEMYARFAALGMRYGPAFQGISRLWRGSGAALGEIVLPAAAGDPAPYTLHPALLDACFQVAGALLPPGDDAIYLPIGMEGVSLRGTSATRLWSFMRAYPGNDSATLTCSIDIFDDSGTSVATITRANLRRAPRSALAALSSSAGTPSPLYDLVWSETPREVVEHRGEPGRWLLFTDSGGVGAELAQLLVAQGDSVDSIRPSGATGDGRQLDPANPAAFARLLQETTSGIPLRGVVYLWGADTADLESDLACGLQGTLHLAQALAEEELAPLWLVTRGSQPAGNAIVAPAQAAIWGFARSLAREHPRLRPTCVDLEPGPVEHLAADLLAEIHATNPEDAVALRGGKRLVARLVPHRASSPEETPVRLEVSARGSLDALALQPIAHRTPGPGEIKIQVHATGLNFRDVLNVLGLYPGPVEQPGSECAGIVTAVGAGVTEWQVGDRVVALTEGCFSTFAIAPAVLTARLPAGMSFAQGASLPIAFVTAAYALRHLAQVQPGARVLIHAASGGVGLAAVQIARAAGAEVFATAGNDEKRAWLRSLGIEHVYDSRSSGFARAIRAAIGGAGVDIVLNSLTGEMIPESLSALRDDGCFLEIGKRDIWTPEQVAALGRDITYHVIYMGAVYEQEPQLACDLLRGVCAEVAAGTLQPLPLRAFPLASGVDAFRFMGQTRHIGKIVLTQDHPVPFDVSEGLRSDATYLVTGAMGGLGMTVARWLVQHGARNLVLLGRRAPNASASACIEELRAAGVHVRVEQADVGNRDELARVLDAIEREMPPLAGIVHAAGALDDGVISQQTWARFETTLHPKMRGAWHLHTLTADRQLDFFILFSSGAVLVGAPSQANYAAANAGLDALAHWRRLQGLPALSVNWGPWGEVGMAAGLANEQRQRMAEQGFRTMHPDEALTALEDALSSGAAQMMAMPADWDTFASKLASPPPSLFRNLVRTRHHDTSTQAAANGDDMAARLAALPASLRQGALLRYVREQGAHVLGLAGADALPPGRPLNELGLDSLMAVDLRNVLARGLQLTLPTTLLFDYPSPDALTAYLLTKLPEAGSRAQVSNAIPDVPPIDLTTLTDAEAEALLIAELGR